MNAKCLIPGVMILYYYEKKGLWVLSVLMVALIFVPRQLRLKKQEAFWLECMPAVPDSVFIPENPARVFPIELNGADSATLVRIRGIGPYYARKIIRYREKLGGYYKVGQLKELRMTYFDVDSAAGSFTVNPKLIRKKDLNALTFKEVLRHPYLEYEDVKLIFNAKNKYKKVNIDTLGRRHILPAYKLKKIKPYFL